MDIVIMAGGRGTRIAQMDASVPKPMLLICGKPILEHQIEALARQGYKKIILVIGYKGEIIRNYFEDGSGKSPVTGEPFDARIEYIEEKEPLGTAGSLSLLKDRLSGDFLVLNGDVIFDVDIHKMAVFHKQHGKMATILTHPNDHPFDSGLIAADDEGTVVNWLHKEEKRLWHKNRVNAGIHMISPRLLREEQFSYVHKMDLDREVLKPLIKRKQLVAYDSPEYVKDMGTPERFREVERDLKSGKVAAKNLAVKQKAVFIDRDGTINKYVGFLTKPEEFELIPGAAEAIRKINQSGYLAIVVTNQPVIARGEVSLQELQEIHDKMETLLGNEGAYLDHIYFCPHHPDRGFPGERVEYKTECNCRKPKTGLVMRAVKEYNIDIGSSYVVGDSENDVLLGKHAGAGTIYIGNRNELEVQADYYVNSLYEAVEWILCQE